MRPDLCRLIPLLTLFYSSNAPVTLRPSRSMHIREGAHPPSTDSGQLSPQTSPQSTMNESGTSTSSSQEATSSPATEEEPALLVNVPSISRQPSSTNQPAPELRREVSWVNMKVSVNTPPVDTDGGPPPSPTMASSPLKSTLSNWKRFSALPRTPSLMTMSLMAGAVKPSRTPSPSLPSIPPIRVRRKVISPWPDAMRFNDVLINRSALDRSIGYANKINELAMYDCGLGDWVSSVKHRGV